MYSPVKDGIEKSARLVRYAEAKPPKDLSGLVDCFWELKTDSPLKNAFRLHALPDACVNILFNQIDTQIAGVTALHTTFEVLNLGKEFHYVGIQFLPGVWRGDAKETANSFVGTPYIGSLPLIKTNNQLTGLDFEAQQMILSKLVRQLMGEKLITPDPTTEKILANLDTIHTVSDMAAATGMSTRQLQRTLKQTTGLSPHDLLKVLRLQQSFKGHYLASYADQSHYIHSFRKITGYTPAKYINKFDV